MPLKTTTGRTVFIPKPLSKSYATAMTNLRIWLDDRKMQPLRFKIATDGAIGFEISFSSEGEAKAFELFDWLRS